MKEQPFSGRLEHLPSELIVEILKEIDWRDLLSIRKTSKHLSDLSKALPIWRHLFLSYTSNSETLTLRLERPLELYTSSELEHLILRWKSADIGWTKDDKFPARQRAITLRIPQSRPFHLIEGGRWVLFATTGGSVEYVDLDAQDMVERNLVPVQTSGSSTKMAVDIDYNESTLTFNLALSISTRNGELLQIWNVTLVLDEERRGIGLSSQCLASFTPNPNRPLEGISIGGPYIVYYFWAENHDPETHLAVVNWRASLMQGTRAEPTSSYPMRIISYHLVEKVNAVHFLPGDKLFISISTRMLFYDLQSIPESATFQLPPGPIAPSIEYRAECSLISRPFVFSNSIRFVFFNDNWIQGITIDFNDSHNLKVQVNKLMDAPVSLFRGVIPVLGYKRGVFTRRNGGIVILSYPWPEDKDYGSSSVILKNFSREDWTGRIRGVEECSGRILLEPFILSKPVIALDIALIYRNIF